MPALRTDANRCQIDMRVRGLMVCDWCGLVMSEGFIVEGGDSYACSEDCLAADPGWVAEPDEYSQELGLPVIVDEVGAHVHITNELIGLWLEVEERGGPEAFIYWTDWEGCGSHDTAIKRLYAAPYNMSIQEQHEVGAHDGEIECSYCNENGGEQ
jgi:hypothetical protein